MSSPNEGQAALVAKEKSTVKMVKILAKHPIRTLDEQGYEKITTPGNVVEVTEEEAKEFCDKKIDIGYKDVFGQREHRDIKRSFVVRAERVK